MPRSSVNFVREFVPALRQLDGTLALDVNVGGTIAQPALSGAADMNINVARFENATLPALTNFQALLNFRENTPELRPLRRRSRGRALHAFRQDLAPEINRADLRSSPESEQRPRRSKRQSDRARRCRRQRRGSAE